MNPINIKAAAPSAIMVSLGAAIKAHITQNGTIKQFLEDSGIGRATLYRLFDGKTVGTDILIAVLQSLGRYDLLESLVAEPRINPMQMLKAQRVSVGTPYKHKRPSKEYGGGNASKPNTLIIDGLAQAKIAKLKSGIDR
jgi:hypothetical protein